MTFATIPSPDFRSVGTAALVATEIKLGSITAAVSTDKVLLIFNIFRPSIAGSDVEVAFTFGLFSLDRSAD